MKQSELEELSFMYAYPEEHAKIKQEFEAVRKKQEDVVLEVTNNPLESNINSLSIKLNLTPQFCFNRPNEFFRI